VLESKEFSRSPKPSLATHVTVELGGRLKPAAVKLATPEQLLFVSQQLKSK
jgi:hypothetical protein